MGVAAEDLQFLTHGVIDAPNVLVVVEAPASISRKVVYRPVMIATGVWRRQQSQDVLGCR